MKVKVKCDHKDFNNVNLGIHWRCLSAPWIFDFFIDFWDIWKKLKPLFSSKNRTQARFFWLFEQTTEPILIKILGKIEYDVPNKKPMGFGPISLKVKSYRGSQLKHFKCCSNEPTDEGQGKIRSRTFIYRYLRNLSVMSNCYSDFWYLDWFWSYNNNTCICIRAQNQRRPSYKKWNSSNQRRCEQNWLEGESRGEQVWFQLFFKAINRCACFDSARQGVPNCGASYPETTRTKTGAYKRSDKSMSIGRAKSSSRVVWLNEWRQIWRGSWVKWFVCKKGYLVLYTKWDRKPMDVFQQWCCTGARLGASYYSCESVLDAL